MKKLILFLFILLNNSNLFSSPNSGFSRSAADLLIGSVHRIDYNDSFYVYDQNGNLLENTGKSYSIKRVYQSPKKFTEGELKFHIEFTNNQRIECITNENLCETYTFDEKNRPISKDKPGYGESVYIEYFYKGDEKKPFKEKKTVNWEEGTTIYESTFTYPETDDVGNWLKCKKVTKEIENGKTIDTETKVIDRKISYYSEGTVAPLYSQNKPSFFSNITANISSIFVGSILIFIIGHMIFSIITAVKYRNDFTTDSFRQQRKALGLSEESSDQENEMAIDYLNLSISTWKEDKNDPEQVRPRRLQHIKSANVEIAKTVELKPTNEDVVAQLNSLKEVINSNTKRLFDGSIKLIVISSIIAIIFWLIGDFRLGVPIFVGIGLYILSSMTPAFLVRKRAERTSWNLYDGIFAGVFAVIAGAQTIRETKIWSDGSKEVNDDHSQHFIAWVFGAIVAAMMAVLMSVWALLNYLRNYVLYI